MSSIVSANVGDDAFDILVPNIDSRYPYADSPEDSAASGPSQGLETPDPYGDLRKIIRRVCLIRREEGSESTGFLVGPDLMLTAAHTLRGTSGIFADPDDVTILFDQMIWNQETQTIAYGDSCKLRRIPFTRQPDVLASSILTDARCVERKKDTDLDYVLVRLDRPIGLSFLPYSHRIRGWNDCHVARIPVPAPGEEVLVVQHPLGGLQQFARGEILPALPSTPAKRFAYRTVTFNGASGAPIVNLKKQVIGLHVGERMGDDGHPIQFGVSFQDIFAELEKQGVALPAFRLGQRTMDTIFGTSKVERKRKRGKDWRGDRLFD